MQQIVESVEKSGLVFIENNKIFTDSLTIAEVFQKGHDKVLRDIRGLKCSEEFRLVNYGESTYRNKQGRIMPSFIMTFDGFAMLAMGYTGEKAMKFKEMYIAEFNRTREILESQKITLHSREQKQIQDAVRTTIYNLYPTITDNGRRKYFARLYGKLKEKFGVNSFRDIRRSDFDNAITFIEEWDAPKLESGKSE